VALVLLVPPASTAAEPVPLLKTIKAVGTEGNGNAEASQAWKELVQIGLPALIPTLEAIDEELPRANNWLRAAVDAISQKTLDSGKTLPVSDLEAFVSKTSNSPTARRAAYEWLVKVEPKAADRLLPKMLNDASAEMRRDAVALVIKEATAKKDDKEAALVLWDKALTASRDKDQVEAIAKAMEMLGKKVDLPKHFGFVTTWYVATPFENKDGNGYKEVYDPEKGVDLKATYKGKQDADVRWESYTTPDKLGLVDFNKVFGEKKAIIAYAYATVVSPVEQRVEIRIGTNNAMKMYFNNKLTLSRPEYHHGFGMDQYFTKVTLNKGNNQILVKICQNEQKEDWARMWSFQLRLCDSIGGAVPFTVVAPDTKGDK